MKKLNRQEFTRRDFLSTSASNIAGGWAALHFGGTALARSTATRPYTPARIPAALTSGPSRADNIFEALKLIEGQIKKGLVGKKRVVIKPNMVVNRKQLAASHVDCLEPICELISSMYKGEILLGDSSAGGSVKKGFENYDYLRLEKKYRVRFIDLDEQAMETRHVVDERYRPRPVRLAKVLLDPETYVVSAAVLKTHDRAIITLSLKNVVVGAAKKDKNFHWGPGSKGSNDKMLIHGGPENEGIHYNLFQLGKQLHPDLAVLDGFQGMEGNGPVGGTAVDHRVAVASTDWLAADRIGTELMGFDFEKVGYLYFSARAGVGQSDLEKIEIRGQKVADHIKQYHPHKNIEQQYKWMEQC